MDWARQVQSRPVSDILLSARNRRRLEEEDGKKKGEVMQRTHRLDEQRKNQDNGV